MTAPRSSGRREADPVLVELPCSLSAEKAVIGGIMIDNAGCDTVSRIVQPAHFFREAHRRIFTVVLALRERDQPIDMISVKEELDKHPLQNGETWLDDVGGPAYVASLVDGVPRSTNVKYYAEVVLEKSMLRKLFDLGSKVAKGALANDAEARRVINNCDAELTALSVAAGQGGGAVPLSDDLGALMADLDHRVKHRGQVSGMATGYPELDLLTHGWQRRQMVVIAGQTSFGKSVLALNLAHAIAASGKRVVYYSYEMERKELEYRLLSSIAEIPLTAILWGALSDAQYRTLAAAMETMHALPLEINDGSSRSIADARSECRQVKADRGLDAVVFDHFQLMDGVQGENRTQELGGVSRAIQRLGVELDVTTFTLSQLTLSGADASHEPQLDHLRECKQLGHDANIVAMLSPHKFAELRSENAVVLMKLLCRKNRGGRLGTIWLDLERDYVRFVKSEAPRPEPKPAKAEKASSAPLRY